MHGVLIPARDCCLQEINGLKTSLEASKNDIVSSPFPYIHPLPCWIMVPYCNLLCLHALTLPFYAPMTVILPDSLLRGDHSICLRDGPWCAAPDIINSHCDMIASALACQPEHQQLLSPDASWGGHG